MQLDLLKWRAAQVEVIPFPTRLRTGKIKRTAEVLLEGTKKGAAYHWRRTIDDMRRQMERAGIAADQIESEITAFTNAVDVEIARRTRGRMRMRPEDGDVA